MPRTSIELLLWHLWKPVPPLDAAKLGVPVELTELAQEMLSKNPAARPTMRDVVDRLRRVRAALQGPLVEAICQMSPPRFAPRPSGTLVMSTQPAPASSGAGAAVATGPQAAPSHGPVVSSSTEGILAMLASSPPDAVHRPAASSPQPASIAASAPGGAPRPSPPARVGAVPARTTLLPVPTLRSADAPAQVAVVVQVPKPSLAPAAPADLRTSDAPLEATPRRSSLFLPRGPIAAVMLASGLTLAAAGFAGFRLWGALFESQPVAQAASSAVAPPVPPPPSVPAAPPPPSVPAAPPPSTSANAPPTKPAPDAKAAPAKGPGQRPTGATRPDTRTTPKR